MANLSITRRCNRKCAYCFAKHERELTGVIDMPRRVYDQAISFLTRSGIPEARFLGGEPTEHPAFTEYVADALERGFRIVVFSGGVVRDGVLEFLADLPDESVQLVLNAVDPAVGPSAVLRRQEHLCRMLRRKVLVGVNISYPGQRPFGVLDWIDRFDLQRRLRVGLAHPTLGGANSWFRLRAHRPVAVLENLFRAAVDRGVEVGFDCGFTPCMFTEAFLDEFPELLDVGRDESDAAVEPGDGERDPGAARPREASIGRCSSVIDILPDGACIACYALSRVFRLPLPEETERTELLGEFETRLNSLVPAGIYAACGLCRYRADGSCDGGCRARRALRLRPDFSQVLSSGPDRHREEAL